MSASTSRLRAISIAIVILAACGVVLAIAVTTHTPTNDTGVSDDNQPSAADERTDANEVTPIYVTLGSHNERGAGVMSCPKFQSHRENVIDLLDVVEHYDAAWDWQSDYVLLRAVADCETTAMREQTDGKNLVQYLYDHGVQPDPHAHEDDAYNYADVAYLLTTLVEDYMPDVVGGFELDNREQFARLSQGFSGNAFPSFTWRPSYLTFGAIVGHANNQDDYTSGMWRPADIGEPTEGSDYLTHDEDAELASIGPGYLHSGAFGYSDCHYEKASDYIIALADAIAQGEAPAGELYTATIAIPDSTVQDGTAHRLLPSMLEDLQPLVDEGRVIYVTYDEVGDIWQRDYDGNPSIFTFDQIPESTYTCDEQSSARPPKPPKR